jgi:hypothetical protein
MAKAKKSKAAKKKKAKKPARRAAAKAKRGAAKTKKVKKAKRPARKAAPAKAKKSAKKAAPKKKQAVVGEGNYAASRAFDKDQTNFVKRNKAKIPEMGKEAEKALDGPEGAGLKAAEQEAMNRSVIE